MIETTKLLEGVNKNCNQLQIKCVPIINQISGCFDLALCFSGKNNLELHLSGDLSQLSSARSTRLGHWLLEGHVLQMLRWQLKSQGQAPEARAESRGHERPMKENTNLLCFLDSI